MLSRMKQEGSRNALGWLWRDLSLKSFYRQKKDRSSSWVKCGDDPCDEVSQETRPRCRATCTKDASLLGYNFWTSQDSRRSLRNKKMRCSRFQLTPPGPFFGVNILRQNCTPDKNQQGTGIKYQVLHLWNHVCSTWGSFIIDDHGQHSYPSCNHINRNYTCLRFPKI